MPRLLQVTVLTTLLLTSAVPAQLGRQTLDLDVQGLNASTGNLGVVSLGDEIFVTSRGNGATTVPPHTVWVFDRAGTLLRQFAQPASTATSFWGYRDGATDGRVLIFGFEGGLEVLDTVGQPASELLAGAGPQPVIQPIEPAGIVSLPRAVAYDPDGNRGLGSLFVGDHDRPVEEIALDGSVLHSYPNDDGWSAAGLARSRSSGTLWISTSPDAGALVEYDIDRINSRLLRTGRSVSRRAPGSTQGGLDIVPGGLDGRACGEDLLALDQAASDRVTGYRIDLWDGWPSQLEPRLLVAVDDGPLRGGELEVSSSAGFLQLDLATPGRQYFVFADAVGAAPRPPGSLLGMKALWELTHPRHNSVFLGPALSGTRFAIDASAFTATPPGTQLTWQAVVVDPSIPTGGTCGLALTLAVTDQPGHLNVGSFIARVTASGRNSFNSDSRQGFFRIEAGPETAADPITQLTFDWAASSNPAQQSTVFDTDQPGMLGAFWNGDGNPPSCGGTYRNASDQLAGLDYAAAQNNLASTCPGAGLNAGCEAAGQIGTGPDYRTLTWRFASGLFRDGTVFEVDIDTDFGPGVSGDAMAGLAVTITRASGAVSQGELQADPQRAQAASLRL